MPGPPPPPPPGGPPPMMPPPPIAFNSGGPDNRGALLNSIRKGSKLKKTVTNDKSAPAIGGKVSNSNNNTNASPSGKVNGPVSSGAGVPNGLGGLFAGGMPKLKPTGKPLGVPTNVSQISLNSSNNRVPDSPSSKSFSSIQNELKRQMANDSFSSKRGPPPPTPTRSYNNLSEETNRLQLTPKNESSNGFHSNVTTPSQIGLHRKTQSNVNISTLETTDLTYNNNPSSRPVINHGKPNLAPKPPILNGRPAAPPKKLLINGKPVGRAQSMRSPRSPSPQSPDNNSPDYNKFATARNLSQVLNQSLGNLSQNKSRPLLNGRPSAPPPSIPNTPPPPPPNKMVKPPTQAPPPPPNMIPQAPNHAPPPPPHRTGPLVPSRAPPSVPGVNAPPPPPRHSSIRDLSNSKRNSNCDLESRFTFKKVTEFPRPPAYRNVSKVYTSRQGLLKIENENASIQLSIF